MKELQNILNNESLSLVVKQGEDTYKYSGRGVSDLYSIVCNNKLILNGALIADKIVGKGAAALMSIGKVRSLITTTISRSALQLLELNGVEIEYENLVENIINRTGTDICPVEKLCSDDTNLNVIFDKITTFLENIKKNSSK